MNGTREVATGGDGWRQAIAGILLMAAGVVLLLDQQRIIEVGSIWRWWPLVLVAIGLWKATSPGVKRDIGGGLELMIFGTWIMACMRHWWGLTFVNSWPLVFVGMGVKMIVKSLAPPRPKVATEGKGESHA